MVKNKHHIFNHHEIEQIKKCYACKEHSKTIKNNFYKNNKKAITSRVLNKIRYFEETYEQK
jgi:hypothetical protein